MQIIKLNSFHLFQLSEVKRGGEIVFPFSKTKVNPEKVLSKIITVQSLFNITHNNTGLDIAWSC